MSDPAHNDAENGKTADGRVRSIAVLGSLANDIARCDGNGSVEDGVQYWREGCEACLRRVAPRPRFVSMILPPTIIAFECEYLIEPNSEVSGAGATAGNDNNKSAARQRSLD